MPKLRAYYLDARAAGARLPLGVHDADVPALAPVGHVALVAVGYVDLVAARTPAHLVAVGGILAGQNEVVAALEDYVVPQAVALALEDLVVVARGDAGQHIGALD